MKNIFVYVKYVLSNFETKGGLVNVNVMIMAQD